MRDALGTLFGQRLPAPMEGAIEKLLLLDRLEEICGRAGNMPDDQPFSQRLLESLRVRTVISSDDLARVPGNGPLVVVANHPFGLVEGAILDMVLSSARPDIKFMANYLLGSLDSIRDRCIFVDPFGGEAAARANHKGLKESIEWLRQGGTLAVFPAGEVSHLNLKRGGITDPEWSHTIARVVRITKASVLPVYFRGANSPAFQILGLIHPRVRTALLAREFFNKQDTSIELRIGKSISAKKIERHRDDESLIRYLRHRTYLLHDREMAGPRLRSFQLPLAIAQPAKLPIISRVPAPLVTDDIARLKPHQILLESGEFSVVLARAEEIPNAMREIGRLREVTFRHSGEGTGKEVDIDAFDTHYLHLFLWNRQKQEIAGAYRLGQTDEILRRFGPKGLYTGTLFAYERGFLDRINPALELGRSFVSVHYQKCYQPLLLLWKGIGAFVAENPRYKILFGPVSISNEYNGTSRELMVTFLKTYSHADELARLVRARSPFRHNPLKRLPQELLESTSSDIDDLSALIADVETSQKGVPVLLRQYLKLGGKLAAFNVDRRFADALDGLVVVDLTQTDARILERYMGAAGAASFLEFWTRQAVLA